ncbi:TPA: hypothetical protein ACPD39_004499 [Escherichia coli]
MMSPKKKKTLSQPFYQILVMQSLDHFTVKALRDSYIKVMGVAEGDDERRDAYRKVYRQLVRLQRNELVEKVSNTGGAVKYRKTPKFHETMFVEKRREEVCEEESMDGVLSPNAMANSHVLSELHLKAQNYQVDLLTAIGETEEYQRLAKEFPSIQPLFDADYREAREKSSKLLGQLKAIQTVIMQHSQGA